MADLITECAEHTPRGMLILVYHPKRCEELISLLPAQILGTFSVSMYYTLDDSGGNSIVFGAYLDKICWHCYEKLFVFDGAGEADISRIVSHTPSHCTVYVSRHGDGSIRYPFDFSR
jgi:hypothetical protein